MMKLFYFIPTTTNTHHKNQLLNSTQTLQFIKQGVALMEKNTTDPPCSVTVELDWRQHDVIAWPARVKPLAGLP